MQREAQGGQAQRRGRRRRRQAEARLRLAVARLAGGPVARAAGKERMQQRARHEVERRVDRQRPAPAQPGIEPGADRPEHGRGEASEQRQQRDRAAGASAGQHGERGECAVVQDGAHRQTDQRPGEEQRRPSPGEGEHEQAERGDDRGGGHHAARPVAIHQPAAGARAGRGDQQAPGEAAEHRGGAQPEAGGDRPGEDRGHVMGGAPADDLGDPERRDRGADGTGHGAGTRWGPQRPVLEPVAGALRGGGQSSRLSAGNSTTSRMLALSVSSITSRSMPMPQPPVGGMPYSRARM